MSKGKWGGVMVIALLVSAGAGYFLYTQMGTKHLLSVPTETISLEAAAPKASEPEPVEPEEVKPVAPVPRNILFLFPKPSAKSVFIIGDFNDWKRGPMKKQPKGWEVTIPLEPGAYKYMFVVDGKRVKDPNNKNVDDGKSVITVKPLS